MAQIGREYASHSYYYISSETGSKGCPYNRPAGAYFRTNDGDAFLLSWYNFEH